MSRGWPQAAPIVDEGVLPVLVEKSRLHLGLAVGIAAALLLWAVLRWSIWGYEIRAVGLNPRAAAFAGISVDLPMLRVALLSGGLAGMAGVGEVEGLKGHPTLHRSPGFGSESGNA